MRYFPAIRNVNLLFLVTLILVVVIGSAVQAWNPGWGLIITELFLILLPALLFLRITHYPVRETTRLYWPGTGLAGLSLLVGVSFAPVAAWLAVLLTELFGYSFALPPEFFPANFFEAVILFSALAFAAPICEEFLFRGVIQRGYLRRGPWTAILLVGLYFAVFHLSFQRLFAIAPVALLLGYVAWRSDSLIPSILVHFSYNALSGVLLVVSSLRPEFPVGFFGSPAAAGLGLFFGMIGLWLFSRRAVADVETQDLVETQDFASLLPLPADAASEAKPPPDRSSWLGNAWPIAVVFLIFFSLAGLEFVIGRFPQVLASGRLEFGQPPWQPPATWRYELRNILDEPVGQAECSLRPEAESLLLDCQVKQEAFQAQQGDSSYQTGAYELHQTARWDKENLLLLEAHGSRQGDSLDLEWSVVPSGNGLLLSGTSGGSQLEALQLPPDALLQGEWPWRMSALPFSLGYGRPATLAWPFHWSEADGENLPLSEDNLVRVEGAEPVWAPAGRFVAWTVSLEDQTAWYDSNPPHTLVRFDDGTVSYLLVGVSGGNP